MEMRLSLLFVDVNLIGVYQRLPKIAPAYGDSILVFHFFFSSCIYSVLLLD